MIDTLKQSVSPTILLLGIGVYGVYRSIRWMMETRAAADEYVTHVVDERVPKIIKDSLSNGISEMIIRLNLEQDKRWADAMARAFREHEERETTQVRTAMEESRKDVHHCSDRIIRRMEEHDERLKHLEQRIRRNPK